MSRPVQMHGEKQNFNTKSTKSINNNIKSIVKNIKGIHRYKSLTTIQIIEKSLEFFELSVNNAANKQD